MIIHERPSLYRLITVDYLSTVAFLVPSMLVVFYLYDLYLGKGVTEYNMTFLLGVLLIGGVVLIWRYVRLSRFFSENVEETATVNGSAFFRGRGKISFSYTHQGKKYLSSSMVMSSKRTKSFQTGQQVVALIDPNNHKKAIIKDLYI